MIEGHRGMVALTQSLKPDPMGTVRLSHLIS